LICFACNMWHHINVTDVVLSFLVITCVVIRRFENVAKLRCLGTTITNQNLTHEEEIEFG
jgi:hypothetical protein